MRKVFAVIVFSTAMLASVGCSKKCSECPAGSYLAVDEPEDGECLCCPDGTTYVNGSCQY